MSVRAGRKLVRLRLRHRSLTSQLRGFVARPLAVSFIKNGKTRGNVRKTVLTAQKTATHRKQKRGKGAAFRKHCENIARALRKHYMVSTLYESEAKKRSLEIMIG
jgi:hypothetical protein